MFTHFYKPGLRQSCCVININFADNIQVATMMHGMYVFVEKSHLKFHNYARNCDCRDSANVQICNT